MFPSLSPLNSALQKLQMRNELWVKTQYVPYMAVVNIKWLGQNQCHG